MTVETVWIKLKEAEKLGLSIRTLNRKCSTGQYVSRRVPSPGKRGFSYEVALASLPKSARDKYWAENKPVQDLQPQNTEIITLDPEAESNFIAALSDWERQYVNHFISLYQITRSVKKKVDLEFYLRQWANEHPKYAWSYKSFMRIKKIYEDSGCSALAITPKWGKKESSVTDEMLEPYETQYLTERQPSSYSCWKVALGSAIRKNPSLDVSKFPSHMAFLRKLKSKYPEGVIYYMRNGLAKWKAKYGYHISRHYDELLCGEAWCSDHVQSDVAIRTPDGKIHFPWITVWIDVKSKKWLSWFIHIEPPKSEHIFTSFYRAAKRWGIPSDVIIDNGKDYRCKALTGGRISNGWHKIKINEVESVSLFGGLKISVHFAWPYNPESKICERTFSSINSGFSSHCVGYRGPDIKERPEALKKELKSTSIWSEEEFISAFDRYIVEGYNRDKAEHSKILKGMCPDELFNLEWPQAIKEERVYQVSAVALKMFCSPLSEPLSVKKARVHDKKYDIYYYAPWMTVVNGGKVRMRRDNADYSIAYFWNDDTGEYLGTAELDGNVSALARTPLEKKQLEEAIKRKRTVERAVKTIARTIAKTDNNESIENQLAGIAALNSARNFNPVDPVATENYLVTSMDRIIAEENRRKKETYDYSVDADMEIYRDPLADLDLYGTKCVNW